MTNLFDYLIWRGDLSFTNAPLCEADCLILARLSYLPFDNIVPAPPAFGPYESCKVKDALTAFLASEESRKMICLKEDIPFAEQLLLSPRFAELSLSHFVNHIDLGLQTQFAAVTIQSDSGLCVVSFRGTDTTLVGWKEDANMVFRFPVPAQELSVGYLDSVAEDITAPAFVLCGHSKGGNLSIYSASMCKPETRARIQSVYNFDGPGFNEKFFEISAYGEILDRLHAFVPQSSIVGMLLEPDYDYTIVHSTQNGFMQHNMFSWEIIGTRMVPLDTVTKQSRALDQALRNWVAELSYEQRQIFFDSLYSVIESTNAKTTADLTENWSKNARAILKSYSKLEQPVRKTLDKALLQLFRHAGKNAKVFNQETEDEFE